MRSICLSLLIAAAAAKSLQSCPTPCDPVDGSPPGSPVPGILQARTLEWASLLINSCLFLRSQLGDYFLRAVFPKETISTFGRLSP